MTATNPPETIGQASARDADDALEKMLRADAAQWRDQYVHNDGFSDRVMQRIAALPAPRHAGAFGPRAKRRLAIVSATAALASALVFFGTGGVWLIDAVMDLATQTISPHVLLMVSMLAVAAVLSIGAASSEH